MATRPEHPLAVHARVQAASAIYGHVIDHGRLRALGVTRWQARAQVNAGRWVRRGRQTFATAPGQLEDQAARWRAVWEAGERIALVDGVSALRAHGLKGWSEDLVHISAVHNHNVGRIEGVSVHKVARRVEGERTSTGLPCTQPAVAAVRAAHWAVSDRQAATLMAMTVQQRLATGQQLLDAVAQVRGRNRRAFIHRIALDVADGAHALGELEFAAACRRRGMPEPTRQSIRRLSDRKAYLDVFFEEYGVVVEIDGAGHQWGLKALDDHLRDNAVVINGDRVLRINVIGLRLHEDEFMEQVRAALQSEWAQANRRAFRKRAG